MILMIFTNVFVVIAAKHLFCVLQTDENVFKTD